MISGFDTRKFEGLRLNPYRDTVGKLTIGYGHNLQTIKSIRNCLLAGIKRNDVIEHGFGITIAQAEALFKLDYADARADAESLVPKLSTMPEIVQLILTDLSFNMGRTVLSKFHNTLKAFNRMDWKLAAQGLRASKWFGQVKSRGVIIVTLLESKELNG